MLVLKASKTPIINNLPMPVHVKTASEDDGGHLVHKNDRKEKVSKLTP